MPIICTFLIIPFAVFFDAVLNNIGIQIPVPQRIVMADGSVVDITSDVVTGHTGIRPNPPFWAM